MPTILSVPVRNRLPNRRYRTPVSFEMDGHVYSGGAGHYPDGRIGEVFLMAGKTGTHLAISISESCIAASLAMQFGCPIETLRDALLKDDQGRPAGALGRMFEILTATASEPK